MFYRFSAPQTYVDNSDATPDRYWIEGELQSVLGAWTDAVVAHLAGRMPHLDLPLDVRATAFQRRV